MGCPVFSLLKTVSDLSREQAVFSTLSVEVRKTVSDIDVLIMLPKLDYNAVFYYVTLKLTEEVGRSKEGSFAWFP